jgi:hypothetical protein
MHFANGDRSGALPGGTAGAHAPSGPMIWGAEPNAGVASLHGNVGQGRRRASATLHVGLSVRWSTSFSYGHCSEGS